MTTPRPNPLDGLPPYRELDTNGAADQAAERMEARSSVPASDAMFEALVAPLLDAPESQVVAQSAGRRILELGCGSAALSRRIANHARDAHVVATDKSPGMIEFARARIADEDLSGRVRALVLDALLLPRKVGGPVDRILWQAPLQSLEGENATVPPGFEGSETSLMDISEVRSFLGVEAPHTVLEEDTLDEDDGEDTDDEDEGYSLIISSVMMPYFDVDEQRQIIDRLVARLSPGGSLCFVEQDLLSDFVTIGDIDLERRALGKDIRSVEGVPSHALRGLMRDAGLEMGAQKAFLWTCDELNPYVSTLLEASLDAGVANGRVTVQEKEDALKRVQALHDVGDFSYGITYRRISGSRPA